MKGIREATVRATIAVAAAANTGRFRETDGATVAFGPARWPPPATASRLSPLPEGEVTTSGEAGTGGVGGDGLADEPQQLLAEDLTIESPRVSPELVRIPGCGFGAVNRPDQGVNILVLEEDARAPVDHRVEGAAAGVGDDWPTAGVGFQRGDAEVLLAGKDQGATAGVQLLE